jgi:HAMP domain-containing protein
LRETPWSLINFLAKVFSVLGAIFGPALNPEVFSWFREISIPVFMIFFAVILLWLLVARAKLAMRQATSNPDLSVQVTRVASPRASVQPSELEHTSRNTITELRHYSLFVKLAICFGGVGILFGVAVCIIVNGYIAGQFGKATRRQAQVMALGVSDAVSRQIASKDISALSDAVDKIASVKAVAYLYVENSAGQIIAYAPKDLLRFLNRDFPRSAERALNGIDTQYRDSEVYEIACRVGNGKDGFVHLGIWRNAIDDDTRAAVTPIAASIFGLIVGVTIIFVFVAMQLHRPFLELVEQAERISRGDFEVQLNLKREDEIGDIARSLERMRSSLHAVLRRLETADEFEQSGKEF